MEKSAILADEAEFMLGFFFPQTKVFVRGVVSEVVALTAAFDAALVGRAAARGFPVTAVLQHARVPLQSEVVAAGARLPKILHQATALQARNLHVLRQDLEHGALHTCTQQCRHTVWTISSQTSGLVKKKLCIHLPSDN